MKLKMTAIIMVVCTVLLGSGAAVYAQPHGFDLHFISRISRSIRGIDSSSVAQQGSSFVASYKAEIPTTPNGTDVTNIMIFEQDAKGDVRVVAYPRNLAPGSVSVLNDTLSFEPTSVFIVGLNLRQPSDSTEKNHVVMFVNDDFASGATGKQFSEGFAPLHESTFIKAIQLASAGDTNSMELLKSDFATLHAAAFAPGEKFTVIKSSVIAPLPPAPGVPEIDPSAAAGALALISGAVLIIRGRRRKNVVR